MLFQALAKISLGYTLLSHTPYSTVAANKKVPQTLACFDLTETDEVNLT